MNCENQSVFGKVRGKNISGSFFCGHDVLVTSHLMVVLILTLT